MTELPIVVEKSAWLSLVFGGLIIGSAFYLMRAAILKRNENAAAAVFAIVTAFPLLAFGSAVALQPIDWQLRFEERGIVLHAPFDLWRPGDEIAWSDVESVVITPGYSYRSQVFHLIVEGKNGKRITVASADTLPPNFGPLLQKIVLERAPQAKNAREIAQQAQDARSQSYAILAVSYRIRDAHGEWLR